MFTIKQLNKQPEFQMRDEDLCVRMHVYMKLK